MVPPSEELDDLDAGDVGGVVCNFLATCDK